MGARQIQVSGIRQQTFDKNPFYANRGLIWIRNTKLQQEFLWRNSVLNVFHSNLQCFQAVPKPSSSTKQVFAVSSGRQIPIPTPVCMLISSAQICTMQAFTAATGALLCVLLSHRHRRRKGLATTMLSWQQECSQSSHRTNTTPAAPSGSNGLRVLQIRITSGSY